MVMVKCTRKGCGKDFDPADNVPNACSFHPGGPVFHEGLKSWSCCKDVNKPVLDFDEFMQLPGCHEGAHTDEPPKIDTPAKATPSNALAAEPAAAPSGASASAPAPAVAPAPVTLAPAPAPEPAPVVIEEDDPSASVPTGTKCRHHACTVAFESDALHRNADAPESKCVYHTKAPIFHEGSKGYLCCKPRVLEFDEFLKIKGCTEGRHVFVPKVQPGGPAEEFTEARIDHYQTPKQVHVSVFAKKADQGRSTVKIEETQLHFDLYLPNSKRFKKSIELFGPIDAAASTHKFFGTKVEVVLEKQDTRSWTILEKPLHDLGPVALTFGVSGRTGTIGGKELILDADNRMGRD